MALFKWLNWRELDWQVRWVNWEALDWDCCGSYKIRVAPPTGPYDRYVDCQIVHWPSARGKFDPKAVRSSDIKEFRTKLENIYVDDKNDPACSRRIKELKASYYPPALYLGFILMTAALCLIGITAALNLPILFLLPIPAGSFFMQFYFPAFLSLLILTAYGMLKGIGDYDKYTLRGMGLLAGLTTLGCAIALGVVMNPALHAGMISSLLIASVSCLFVAAKEQFHWFSTPPQWVFSGDPVLKIYYAYENYLASSRVVAPNVSGARIPTPAVPAAPDPDPAPAPAPATASAPGLGASST